MKNSSEEFQIEGCRHNFSELGMRSRGNGLSAAGYRALEGSASRRFPDMVEMRA